MRRSVAEVATARKRIEIQAEQLQQQASKLQEQARLAALAQRPRGPGPRGAHPSGSHRSRSSPTSQTPACPDRGPAGASASRRRCGASRPRSSHVPDPQGDPEGDLHRRRGPDPHRRGRGRDLRLDGRRRRSPCSAPRTRSPQMQARAGAIDELLASGASHGPDSSTTTSRPSWTRWRARARSKPSSPHLKSELAAVSPPAALAAPGHPLRGRRGARSGSTGSEPIPVRRH